MLQGAQGQQILQTSSGQQIVVPIQGQAQQQTIQVPKPFKPIFRYIDNISDIFELSKFKKAFCQTEV